MLLQQMISSVIGDDCTLICKKPCLHTSDHQKHVFFTDPQWRKPTITGSSCKVTPFILGRDRIFRINKQIDPVANLCLANCNTEVAIGLASSATGFYSGSSPWFKFVAVQTKGLPTLIETFRTSTLHVNGYTHQRLPPISPLDQSVPSEYCSSQTESFSESNRLMFV